MGKETIKEGDIFVPTPQFIVVVRLERHHILLLHLPLDIM